MKKIANSLMPIAALVLFGTCLVTVFDLVEVLMTSVGLADGGPSSMMGLPGVQASLPERSGGTRFDLNRLAPTGRDACTPGMGGNLRPYCETGD